MNTASLERCKELFELSGWDGTSSVLQYWVYQPSIDSKRRDKRDLWRVENIMRINEDYGVTAITDTDSFVPAYDAGFLLRKLPKDIPTDKHSYFSADLSLAPSVADTWNACYRVGASFPIVGCTADSPEDALTALAIKLYQEGILK